jgi:uncharacterized protein YraI
MKRVLSTAALSLSFFATTAAIAGEGYVTTNVSLRAGPDSGYPDVAMLYAGTPVVIEGCVDGWSWCDVINGDSRGWMPANYLQQEYEGRRVLIPEYGVRIGIPVIAFVFGSYWDSNYRHRSWYGERERWSRVTPQYQSHVERDYSRTPQVTRQYTADRTRHSGVVTTQSTYQTRTATGTTGRHAVTTEVRPSVQSSAHTKPTQHHAAESRVVVHQHAPATVVQARDSHGQNAGQSRPAVVHRASHSRASAEHNVAQARPAKKEPSSKARPEHQGGKDTEQH